MNPSKFERCVDISVEADGYMEIDCKLGLWSVAGSDKEAVLREAKNYWVKYYRDGEYNELLK